MDISLSRWDGDLGGPFIPWTDLERLNGKLRSKVTVAPDIDEAALRTAALADERVRELLAGKQVRKVIVVPGKLVNIVVAG